MNNERKATKKTEEAASILLCWLLELQCQCS
jgi:hypothetical protein